MLSAPPLITESGSIGTTAADMTTVRCELDSNMNRKKSGLSSPGMEWQASTLSATRSTESGTTNHPSAKPVGAVKFGWALSILADLRRALHIAHLLEGRTPFPGRKCAIGSVGEYAVERRFEFRLGRLKLRQGFEHQLEGRRVEAPSLRQSEQRAVGVAAEP